MDTQPLQDGKKKFELCALRGGGDEKYFSIISSCLALVLELSLELELALELALG